MLIGKLKENKGVTLVELLIVVALIGVVLTPISLFFITNLNSFYHENDRINAQVEAGRIMEELTWKALETQEYDDSVPNKHIFKTNTGGSEKWIFELSGESLSRNLVKTSDTLSEISGNVTRLEITPFKKDGKAQYIEIDLEVTYGRERTSIENKVYFRNF